MVMEMADYVLFSPIGGTDPIENYADGPMLHICRVYKPKKVYLYLSAEMVKHQQDDQRYTCCLERLSEKLSVAMDVELIERPALTEVHLYENFYGEFEEQIVRIQKNHPDSTLILNVSSGTPAMKATLLTLAAIVETYNALAVQVATPMKAQNPRGEKKQTFELDAYWELNADNEAPLVNRCLPQQHINIPVKVKTKIMEGHIKCYDYAAALEVAKEIASFIPAEGISLLQAAVYRLQLNQPRFDKIMNTLEGDYDFIPVKDSSKRAIFESVLWLQIKQKREDYVDFLRGITPVVVNLLEVALKENGINIRSCCECKKRGGSEVYYLKRDVLAQSSKGKEVLAILDNLFGGTFRDCVYTSIHLFAILEQKLGDEKLQQAMKVLRDTEQNARNLAAHTIVAVDDKWIKAKVGYDSAHILDAVKLMAGKWLTASPAWNSYDKMNETLLEMVNTRVR